MLMPASAEFVSLCQSQVLLLTQGLGAALSIVYLTEELTEVADAKLVPLVVYPEAIATWQEDRILSLLKGGQRSLKPSESISDTPALVRLPVSSEPPELHPFRVAEQALLRQHQMVLPLVHEEMVMGLLVTARADRPWTEAEQTQIQQIVATLAIACVLDQRAQWLAQDLRQQRILREQRRDTMDDLLHQFRNPLTALRTFGKLLMKRLQPADANHSVAEGIVRESDRLQDLLKQLDVAADLAQPNLLPMMHAPEAIVDWETQQENQAAFHDGTLASSATPSPLALPPSNTHFLTGAELKLEAHQIADILDPLLESASAIAQDRQLGLQAHLPSHLPAVQTDAKALCEVLSNLIDNAMKYTPTGGMIWIEVMAGAVAERMRRIQGLPPNALPLKQAIVIADTGPGIPPEDLGRLFERHYRGVQAATEIPGTGLGLAIARDLIQAMQGDIQIFSPATTCGLLPTDYSDTSTATPGTAAIVWLPELITPSLEPLNLA
ncbi:MAG: sensor histidine kinase [Oculatellaceae cyanobacterium Prado106]|jgi:hypothetical protein|nr:sensor histidine kinase [Oculatellaceae cyanobacterium Prado106]